MQWWGMGMEVGTVGEEKGGAEHLSGVWGFRGERAVPCGVRIVL